MKTRFARFLLLASLTICPSLQAGIAAIDSVTLDGGNQLLTATVGGTAYVGGTVASAARSSSNVEGSMKDPEGVTISFDGTAPLTAGTDAPAGDTLATDDRVNVNIDGDILTGSAGGWAAANLAQSGGALNLQWGAGLTDNDADPDFFVFEDGGNDDVVVHAILADGTLGVGVALSVWNVVNTGGSLYTQVPTALTGRSVAGVSFAFTDLKDAAGANLTNGTMIKGILIGDTQAADFYEVYANVDVTPAITVVSADGGPGSFVLDWTTDPAGAPVTVRRSTDLDFGPGSTVVDSGNTDGSFDDTEAPAGKAFYRVEAE